MFGRPTTSGGPCWAGLANRRHEHYLGLAWRGSYNGVWVARKATHRYAICRYGIPVDTDS